jgi:soluble lytic murein transglycosylase
VYKHKILILFLLFIFLPLFPSHVHADLSSAVEKHRHIKVTREQLLKLRKYNHLIRYFSSFSYFKPRYKVSPDFVKALILAESNCNTFAVSSKDAIGLGQIIHSTGRKAAKDLYRTKVNFRYIHNDKLKNLKREDLFDPAINILLTCYLISKYNYRFNGRLDLVVSAWNAGENVDSLKIGLPAPYSETHNLIGKVNAYYLSLLRLRRKS